VFDDDGAPAAAPVIVPPASQTAQTSTQITAQMELSFRRGIAGIE